MRILLIEDDVNECEKFKEEVNNTDGVELIAVTNSSTEGLKYVKRYMPEAIILDLELNAGEGSGFEFVKELRKLKLTISPKIFVTTNVCSDSVYDYLHENKVDFIFYKKQEKYSVSNVIKTLLLLQGYSNNNNDNNNRNSEIGNSEDRIQELSDKVNKELDLIGVGIHLQGRKYLHDSIIYILTNENKDDKISINQYLMTKYKKASSTISRAMQNAIIHAWRISSIDDLEKYYTAKINYETGIPTPNEFIYYYVDKIKKAL